MPFVRFIRLSALLECSRVMSFYSYRRGAPPVIAFPNHPSPSSEAAAVARVGKDSDERDARKSCSVTQVSGGGMGVSVLPMSSETSIGLMAFVDGEIGIGGCGASTAEDPAPERCDFKRLRSD